MIALPKIELFIGLQSLITTYPSPPTLRERLLDHLLDLLRATLPDEPLGLKLIATRSLKPDLNGPDLIEALKSANETLLAGIQIERTNKESFFRAYAEFVEEWCRAGIDSNLVSRRVVEKKAKSVTLMYCASLETLSYLMSSVFSSA